MKLRTRIIGISCITVLAAALISELFIWIYTGKNLKNEAILKGLQEYYVLVNKIQQDISEKDESEVDYIYLDYLLKSYNDNYNICFWVENLDVYDVDYIPPENEVEEIYNNTIFAYEQLANLNYKSYYTIAEFAYPNENNYITFAYLNYKGRNYAVFNTVIGDNILLYRLQDITYVQDKIIKLALVMAGITLVVMAVAIFILLMVLKRELKPLQQLNETAKSMAEGYYDKRIVIRRKDEIGQLAENFNKMTEAVEIRTKNLEESEQRKTIFMGNLTHELKTPMTAISGYAQTLLSTKISEEEQREALLYIYQECGRLERLSKKMMNLLELGQGDEIKLEEISAKALFEAAARSCKEILQKKQIQLQCVEQGEHFKVDVDLMTDVLINLIDNAIKASEPGGKIILRAQGNCIEVQDFGRGIPKEEQEKIMEPFYMIDKSRSRKNGGAGLGLALISVIVQKHEIKMSIESETGKGSKFVLEF